jgi:hypothetical protein
MKAKGLWVFVLAICFWSWGVGFYKLGYRDGYDAGAPSEDYGYSLGYEAGYSDGTK